MTIAYFPNGTSGDILHDQCADCPVGSNPDAPCPVLLLQLQYNYDQCDKGQKKLRDAMNLLIDEKGICQMRDVMIKFGTPMGGAECPRCKGKEFEMHHEAGSTGFKECWIQTCAACGHEMNHEIFRP